MEAASKAKAATVNFMADDFMIRFDSLMRENERRRDDDDERVLFLWRLAWASELVHSWQSWLVALRHEHALCVRCARSKLALRLQDLWGAGG